MKKNLKTFVLLYEDGTCSTTEHYEIEPLKICYLNKDVLTSIEPREIKLCVGISELLLTDDNFKSFYEMKNVIKDNLSDLIDFIDENRMMEEFDKPTKKSNSAWDFIHNIEVAVGLSKGVIRTFKK